MAAADADAGAADNPLYCVCKTAYDEDRPMVGCDVCDDWFHFDCVGITAEEAEQCDTWACPACALAQQAKEQRDARRPRTSRQRALAAKAKAKEEEEDEDEDEDASSQDEDEENSSALANAGRAADDAAAADAPTVEVQKAEDVHLGDEAAQEPSASPLEPSPPPASGQAPTEQSSAQVVIAPAPATEALAESVPPASAMEIDGASGNDDEPAEEGPGRPAAPSPEETKQEECDDEPMPQAPPALSEAQPAADVANQAPKVEEHKVKEEEEPAAVAGAAAAVKREEDGEEKVPCPAADAVAVDEQQAATAKKEAEEEAEKQKKKEEEKNKFRLMGQQQIYQLSQADLEANMAKCEAEIAKLELEIFMHPQLLDNHGMDDEDKKEEEEEGDEKAKAGDEAEFIVDGVRKRVQWHCPPHSVAIRADVRTFDFAALGREHRSLSGRLFDVVMMDPPWQLASSNPTRGVAIGYEQLSDNLIRKLPIPVLQENGFLFIWVINAKFRLALELLQTWGYRLVDSIAWVKQTVNRRRANGHGYYLQHAKETCLVGLKGKEPPTLRPSVCADVILAERKGQSQKPTEIYEYVEALVPDGYYLEIFGRRNNLRDNWVTIGNEL